MGKNRNSSTNLIQKEQEQEQEQQRRRQHHPPWVGRGGVKSQRLLFVWGSLYASLLSLFITGLYDFARPFLVAHAASLASHAFHCIERIIAPSSKFCEANDNLTFKFHSYSFAIVGSEIAILAPAILLILPWTHHQWRRSKTPREKSNNQQHEVPILQFHYNSKRTIVKVASLLSIIAWTLWALSVIALVLGIAFGPHFFGIITHSALLAFFAQGVGGIGLLLPSEEDDSVFHHRPHLKIVPAAEWSRNKHGHVQCSSSLKQQQQQKIEGNCDPGAAVPASKIANIPENDFGTKRPSPRQNHHNFTIDKKTISDNMDFLLFFSIKITLLQSPYFLQIGIYLFQHYFPSGLSAWGKVKEQEALADIVGLEYRSRDAFFSEEILRISVLVCTILVPLFTHGVGGILFYGRDWSFHHPFQGGRDHVTAQATGWSLLSVAGLLIIAFMVRGNQHEYLLHSGSVLSWCAEGLLLYSLRNFRPHSQQEPPPQGLSSLSSFFRAALRDTTSFLSSIAQDLIITNMHWFWIWWFFGTLFGINLFSFSPTSTFLDASPKDIFKNMSLLAIVWFAPSAIPYSRHRRRWKRNPIGLAIRCFERFICQSHQGLFSNSRFRFEEEDLDTYRENGAMFALTPHGTLPTSVFPVRKQCDHVLGDVCFFFGSQLALVPGYRFLLSMAGGYLPVEKKQLLDVMSTNQNVSLIPGGVSEMMHCIPRSRAINVSIKHRGFVRLAMQCGYDLVPVFFFHANDQYDNPLRPLQQRTYIATGIPVGVPLYSNRWCLPLSNRTPICVAFGKRMKVDKQVNPTEEQVDALHRLFYEEVLRIWEKYKDEFGYGDRELAYVT